MKLFVALFAIVVFSYLIGAYCPPYFAKIDSVQNVPSCLSVEATRGCGGEVAFHNTCDYSFSMSTPYGAVLIKPNQWQALDQPNFLLGKPCIDNQKSIVDGINVCDENALKNGTTVKYWSINLTNIKDQSQVKINGRTVYEQPTNIVLQFVIAYLILSAIIWLICTRILKKSSNTIIKILGVLFILLFVLILLGFFTPIG